MNDGKSFHIIRKKGFLAVVRKTDSANAAIMDCILNPEKYLEKSRILKDSRSTKAGICRLDNNGTEVFIKRYNNKGFKYTLKYLFRQAKAFRYFKTAWFCENMGIPVPKVIAASSERQAGILKNSYIFLEIVKDLVPTLDFCEKLFSNAELQNTFFDSVSSLFAKMHDSGIVHNDAKLSNIFVRKVNGSYLFGVWDLDAATISGGKVSSEKRTDEAARILSSYAEIAKRFNIKVNIANIAETFMPLYYSYSGVSLNKNKLMAKIIRFTGK